MKVLHLILINHGFAAFSVKINKASSTADEAFFQLHFFAYLPKRYVVKRESILVSCPAVNSNMHESSL